MPKHFGSPSSYGCLLQFHTSAKSVQVSLTRRQNNAPVCCCGNFLLTGSFNWSIFFIFQESANWGVLLNKEFLEISQNSQENICSRDSFSIIKKASLAQVFSCEFCEDSKNTFFTEHLRTTASVFQIKSQLLFSCLQATLVAP